MALNYISKSISMCMSRYEADLVDVVLNGIGGINMIII